MLGNIPEPSPYVAGPICRSAFNVIAADTTQSATMLVTRCRRASLAAGDSDAIQQTLSRGMQQAALSLLPTTDNVI